MNISTDGLRVLVTASASGIGFAVARAFQETGARVHVCDIDEAQLDTCRETLPGAGMSCADISKPDEVDRLFENVVSHLGGLDVLVNNAGIAGPTARVEDVDPDAWDRTMAVNINGQFYCARKAVPLIKRAGGGRGTACFICTGRKEPAKPRWAIAWLSRRWMIQARLRFGFP